MGCPAGQPFLFSPIPTNLPTASEIGALPLAERGVFGYSFEAPQCRTKGPSIEYR